MKRTILVIGIFLCAGLFSGCIKSDVQDSANATPFHNESEPAISLVPLPATELPAVESEQFPSPKIDEGGYFDNALFIGDSIMEGIRQYVMVQRQDSEMLGTARFLTSTMGISLADLVGDRDLGIYFSYMGEEKPLEDIVKDIGPQRVFLLLGLNDLAGNPEPIVKDVVNQYVRLIEHLQAACPNVEFIIITNPPKVISSWLPNYTANRSFGNQLIGEFVDALIQMCQDRGIPYVDAYACLKNKNGALPDEFCRDGYIHLNHQGAAVVVEALYTFAEGR